MGADQPVLPKHEYDFTKLVCQSDLMKYIRTANWTSYVGVDISKISGYVDFLKLEKKPEWICDVAGRCQRLWQRTDRIG